MKDNILNGEDRKILEMCENIGQIILNIKKSENHEGKLTLIGTIVEVVRLLI